MINTAIDGRNICYVAYYRPGNQLCLYPDNGDGTQATNIVLTGNNTISNSQCAISAQASVVQSNGKTLTVTLPLAFNAAFAGFKGVWQAAKVPLGCLDRCVDQERLDLLQFAASWPQGPAHAHNCLI